MAKYRATITIATNPDAMAELRALIERMEKAIVIPNVTEVLKVIVRKDNEIERQAQIIDDLIRQLDDLKLKNGWDR